MERKSYAPHATLLCVLQMETKRTSQAVEAQRQVLRAAEEKLESAKRNAQTVQATLSRLEKRLAEALKKWEDEEEKVRVYKGRGGA